MRLTVCILPRLALAATLVAGGCKKSVTPTRAPAPGRDLPECAEARVPAEELREIRRKGAAAFLDRAADTAAGLFGEPLLAAAQVHSAQYRLAEENFRDDRTPLALFGTYGLNGDRVPYVDVIILNEHRETAALWLFAQSASGEVRRVRIAMPVDCKDPEYVLPQHLLIEAATWSELDQGRGDAAGGPVRLTASPFRRVRGPSLEGCKVAAAAEDRVNGLGNFVVLTEWNAPKEPP
jgi:hypothetical protein